MASRLIWFVVGIIVAIAVVGVGTYIYIRAGGMSMATSARPLPFEKIIARLALRASPATGLAGSFRQKLGIFLRRV